MKSDLNLLPIDDAVDVTSRHNIVDDHDAAFDVRHVTSRPRTLHRASGRRRRRSCRTHHLEHLPEINILGKHQSSFRNFLS
jgi:hypothetical protein